MRVCSIHFDEKWITKTGNKHKIHKNALPNLVVKTIRPNFSVRQRSLIQFAAEACKEHRKDMSRVF